MFSSRSGSKAGSLSYSVISSRRGDGRVSTRSQNAAAREPMPAPHRADPDAVGNPREQARHEPADADGRENLPFVFPRFDRGGGLMPLLRAPRRRPSDRLTSIFFKLIALSCSFKSETRWVNTSSHADVRGGRNGGKSSQKQRRNRMVRISAALNFARRGKCANHHLTTPKQLTLTRHAKEDAAREMRLAGCVVPAARCAGTVGF